MKNWFMSTIFTAATFTVSGCSNIRSYTMPPEKNLLSGSGSIVSRSGAADTYEQIDIDLLLKTYGFSDPVHVSVEQFKSSEAYRYRRNDLQDRIIAASNQRCGFYLRELVSSKSQTQMGWGGLALLLSGAASVVNPATTAKVLAAGSTVATGFNSLYTEAYFNNLAVNVISAGISKQREGILQQISTLRTKNLSEYPVSRAIADAIQYHAACNIVSGLEAAANATKAIANDKGSDPNNPQPTVAPKLF